MTRSARCVPVFSERVEHSAQGTNALLEPCSARLQRQEFGRLDEIERDLRAALGAFAHAVPGTACDAGLNLEMSPQ
jgi:hypothetical protein